MKRKSPAKKKTTQTPEPLPQPKDFGEACRGKVMMFSYMFGLPPQECQALVRSHAKVISGKKVPIKEKNDGMFAIAEFAKIDVAGGKILMDAMKAENASTVNSAPPVLIDQHEVAASLMQTIEQYQPRVLPLERNEVEPALRQGRVTLEDGTEVG